MTRKRKPPRAARRRPSSEVLGMALLAALSGVLWFVACADFDIWPLAWIAAVPGLHAIERAASTRRAVCYGAVTGLVANAGGFYWITKLLTRFAHLSLPVAIFAFLVMAAYQGLAYGLFAWGYRRVRQIWGLPAALVAPVVMVAAELVWPMLFPWYLAITQAWQPHVIQVADLTGPLGVTALLLAVNGGVYELLATRRWRPMVAAAGVLALALGYGELRLRQIDAAVAAAPHLSVGVVQGNVAFSAKGYEHPELAARQLADLKDRSAKLDQAGAELILWSETALPYLVPRNLTSEPPRPGIRTDNGRSLFRAPLLFGALTFDVDANGRAEPKDPYNSAILLDPSGKLTGRYDKMFMVMFSEYIPLVETFPWLRKILPDHAGNLSRGSEAKVFTVKAHDGREVKLAPMICFEDIISAFSLRAGRLHPDLLINVTNDAWFGNTSEPWEHLALSVFRAVEVRSTLVRAVNTGVSAFVDPAGRVYARTYALDPLEQSRPADTLLADAPLLEGGHTVFVAVGDVFGDLCVAATLGLWLVVPWLRARRRRAA